MKLLLIFGLLLTANSGFSSGWVKEDEKFYTKLDHSESSERMFDHGGYKFEQVEQTTAVYAEYGLKNSPKIPLQLSLYSALKTIRRQDPVVNDHFTSRGFTDTDLMAKSQFGQLPVEGGTKGTFYFAGIAGLTLPTTSKKLAQGNEEQQAPEMPADRRFLISSVDRGKPAVIGGVGTTYFYNFLWTNLGLIYKYGTSGAWSAMQTDLALGFSLPHDSWIQFLTSRLANSDRSRDDSSVSRTNNTRSSTNVASLGLTIWNGLAVEPRIEKTASSDSSFENGTVLALGLSFRN